MPDWIASQRRDRGLCERCGQRQYASEWAGTGELLCWPCVEVKRGQSAGQRPGRDWLGMTDPREFDTAAVETQGALFPEPSRTGDIPLFGDQFGQDVI